MVNDSVRCGRQMVNKSEAVVEFDLWYAHERIWSPRRGSGLQTSNGGDIEPVRNDRQREERIDASDAVTPYLITTTYRHHVHQIPLNERWSTVPNLARSLLSSFWGSWSRPPSGSSSDHSSIRSHPSRLCPGSVHFPRVFHPRLPQDPLSGFGRGTQVRSSQLQGRRFAQSLLTPMYVPPNTVVSRS